MRLFEVEARFDEVYEIYEKAFPEIERRTCEGQKEAMKCLEYRLLVKEEDGKILAFLGYWDLPGCIFLEHLATTPECRGKGYGKALVLECIEHIKKPVFLEIEPVTPQNPITARRAGFYERLGFYCNHFPYEQQPLKEGDSPCPLWVVSYGKRYTEEEFLPYKKAIYQYVYQKVAEDY